MHASTCECEYMPACAWTCPYPGPCRAGTCHLFVLSVLMWAWAARRRAVTDQQTNPASPPTSTSSHPISSPSRPLFAPAQGLYILYRPGITSGIWNFYLISGQNLPVAGARATMHHNARGCPVGDARVAEGVSRDSGVQQAPHRRHTHGWKP